MRQKCLLNLSNGDQFEGDLIGAPVNASGELVFTTGMVGYSEALTDPSYFGQILTFTYPLIGNYGIPKRGDDSLSCLPLGFESVRTQVAAVIISIDSAEVFHWEAYQSLDHWLKEEAIPGIVGIDTRHLVHLIRSQPKLKGRVIPANPQGYRYAEFGMTFDEDGFYDPGEHDIVKYVSVTKPHIIGTGDRTIGVVDCGIKWNIIRRLNSLGCRVLLVPWDDDLAQHNVDGWLVSNGPGDPQRTGNLPRRVQQLFAGQKPVLGICLGHQVMSLAAGATTRRMEYGHRSHNQPVYRVGTRKGFITTQNHGYVVEDRSLPDDWEVWFRNINDETIEGIRHKSKPFCSVQFHPEASGGPRDTAWVLEQFVSEVNNSCR